MNPTLGTIKIPVSLSVAEGPVWLDVTAEIHGELAIHPTACGRDIQWNGNWSVSHRRTGWAFFRCFPALAEARLAVRQLVRCGVDLSYDEKAQVEAHKDRFAPLFEGWKRFQCPSCHCMGPWQ